MAQSTKDQCPKCGKSRQARSAGSITQWISICSCDQVEEQATSQKICPACGKHLESGRAGSFTQWVFRSDICSCKRPEGAISDEASDNEGSTYRPTPNIPTDQPPLDLDPDTFPTERYKAYKQLGQGAAGTVYLCLDTMLTKEVAVKSLNKLTAEQLVKFQTEAKATSRLNHPHIIKILDFGATTSGAPFMVMEHFPGTSLDTLIHSGETVDVDLILRIFQQVLDALRYAHQNGLIHRDVKPSNILFKNENGKIDVRIIDFGVAVVKQATQEPTIFQGNTIAGTPLYMPPDQFEGYPYNERSEIYAVGCVLFECLSGKPPFLGETHMEVLNKHASEEPPLLKDALSESDNVNRLSAIIDRCLQKHPAHRYKSIDELSKALSHVAGGYWLEYENELSTGANAILASGNFAIQPKTNSSITRVGVSLLVVLIVAVGFFVARNLQTNSHHLKGHTKHLEHFKQQDEVFRFGNDVMLDGKHAPHFTPLDANTIRDEDLRCLSNSDVQAINLDLNGTNLTGDGFRYLTPSKVEMLDLSRTSLNEEGCEALSKLVGLKVLALDDNRVKDCDLLQISKLENLTELRLNGCTDITDAGLSHLLNLKNLEFLALERTKITDAGCETISQFPRLNTILLDDVDISDAGIDRLIKLKTIYNIRLGRAPRITSKSLKNLTEKHPELASLSLCFTDVKPDALKFLRNCPSMVYLQIFGTPIGDNEMKVLGDLKKLEQLYISKISCKEASLKHLYSLRKLLILDFTDCDNMKEETIKQLKAHLPSNCNVVWATRKDSKVVPSSISGTMDLFFSEDAK